MDIDDNNILNSYLLEINNKYEGSNLLDLDFCKLFKLNLLEDFELSNKSILKNKITASYYKLAIKYHPDKFNNISGDYSKINDIYIKNDLIKNGLLLSFIADINKMLLSLTEERHEILINLINKKEIKIGNDIKDFIELKKQSRTLKEENTEENILNFRNELEKLSIKESKISNEEIIYLINIFKEDCGKVQIENLNIKPENFNAKFIEKKLKEYKFEKNKDIMPYNFKHNYVVKKNNLIITDINEAFKLLDVDPDEFLEKKMTLDSYKKERTDEEKKFKFI